MVSMKKKQKKDLTKAQAFIAALIIIGFWIGMLIVANMSFRLVGG
jgi:hypothetical protein